MNTIDRGQATPDKDLPLKEDIRLLGRLLGRHAARAGGRGHLRPDRAASARRPSASAATATTQARARARIDARRARRPRRPWRSFRAFSYFSQLANIAEDLHHNRRRRAQPDRRRAAAGGQPGAGAGAAGDGRAWTRARSRHSFATRWSRPVLTAHPTEVQRKSILDCQREIARLLDRARPPRADAARKRATTRKRCGA